MYTQTNVGLLCCVVSGSNVAVPFDSAATGIGVTHELPYLFPLYRLQQLHINYFQYFQHNVSKLSKPYNF